MDKNHTSESVVYRVNIKTRDDEPFEIPVVNVNVHDGKYYVKSTFDKESEVDTKISYKNKKDQWQKLPGSLF